MDIVIDARLLESDIARGERVFLRDAKRSVRRGERARLPTAPGENIWGQLEPPGCR
jgi:hypothetical protein